MQTSLELSFRHMPPDRATRLCRYPRFAASGMSHSSVVALWLLGEGFLFLRDSTAPRLASPALRSCGAVGGLSLFFFLANRLIEHCR